MAVRFKNHCPQTLAGVMAFVMCVFSITLLFGAFQTTARLAPAAAVHSIHPLPSRDGAAVDETIKTHNNSSAMMALMNSHKNQTADVGNGDANCADDWSHLPPGAFVGPPICVGGGGGAALSQWGLDDWVKDATATGGAVHHLKVFIGPQRLQGICFVTTSGRSHSFGNTDKSTTSKDFTFQPGERITEFNLWENESSDKRQLGAMQFTTDKGNSFEVSSLDMKATSSSLGHRQNDVGSGILMGFIGRAGEDIDCLGPLFLHQWKDIVVTNVTYPGLADLPLPRMKELDYIAFNNCGHAYPAHWRWSYTVIETTSDEWTLSSTIKNAIGSEVITSSPMNGTVVRIVDSVDGGAPHLKWEESETAKVHAWRQDTSGPKTFSFHRDCPGDKFCDFTMIRGDGSLGVGYAAVMQVTLTTGVKLNWRYSGRYNLVDNYELFLRTAFRQCHSDSAQAGQA